MKNDDLLLIWSNLGLLGYFLFKFKELPKHYSLDEDTLTESLVKLILFIVKILGEVFTLYLSCIEPGIDEKQRQQEVEKENIDKQKLIEAKNQEELRLHMERERREEAERIAAKRAKIEQKNKKKQYDLGIEILRDEAKKRIAWQRYHSVSEDIDKADQMSGKEFELFVAKLYEKFGFTIQQISSGADQGADIIMTDDCDIKYAVQTKRWSKAVGNSAVQQVISAKGYYRCKKAIVVTNSYYSNSALELARRFGVILVDRDILIELCFESRSVPFVPYNEEKWLNICHVAIAYLGDIGVNDIDEYILQDIEMRSKKLILEQRLRL